MTIDDLRLQNCEKMAPHQLVVEVAVGDLLDTAEQVARWGYLTAITGLDHGDRLEVLVHVCRGPDVITLRTPLPEERMPTLSAIFPQAGIYERELMEMFGIEVVGAPNTERLYLAEDWPTGSYPLRKDNHD